MKNLKLSGFRNGMFKLTLGLFLGLTQGVYSASAVEVADETDLVQSQVKGFNQERGIPKKPSRSIEGTERVIDSNTGASQDVPVSATTVVDNMIQLTSNFNSILLRIASSSDSDNSDQTQSPPNSRVTGRTLAPVRNSIPNDSSSEKSPDGSGQKTQGASGSSAH